MAVWKLNHLSRPRAAKRGNSWVMLVNNRDASPRQLLCYILKQFTRDHIPVPTTVSRRYGLFRQIHSDSLSSEISQRRPLHLFPRLVNCRSPRILSHLGTISAVRGRTLGQTVAMRTTIANQLPARFCWFPMLWSVVTMSSQSSSSPAGSVRRSQATPSPFPQTCLRNVPEDGGDAVPTSRGRTGSSRSGGRLEVFRLVVENRRHLPLLDIGKPLQELLHGRAALQVLEQSMHRQHRARKGPGTADLAEVAFHGRSRVPIRHA